MGLTIRSQNSRDTDKEGTLPEKYKVEQENIKSELRIKDYLHFRYSYDA